jgi:VWFA-related protein
MAKLLRITAAAVLLAATTAVLPGHAQQPSGGTAPAPQGQPATAQAQSGAQQPPPGPIFRAGINFVRVDVIVSDRSGNPIADLKPGDFEIVEDGKTQNIETFKLVSLDGGLMEATKTPPRQILTDADEETEAARDDVRLFAFFLDDYHVRLENSMSAREQLARFVQTQLGPSDMIGMMYPLEATASVRMTRNHDAITRGLMQFRGRKYDYTPKNAFEDKYAYYPTEIVEKIRNQVSMSAMKALIVHMGGLKEGRKALILVSEGYNSMLPPQMRDQIAAIQGSGNPNALDPFAGQNSSVIEDRAAFSANNDMESDLRDLYDTANRNNVAIYAVDPRGLSTGEFGIDQNISQQTDRQYLNNTMETLRTLAFNTDGRAIVNRNDLTMGMKQIVRDTSAYYLLGYNSTSTATDGKFHEIKVRVKRQGVQVRARKGYWAFTAEDAKRALAPPKPETPKAVDAALASITTPSRSRLVRTWIGTGRGAAGKTKITLVWEPVPRAPGDRPREGDAPARMSVTAVAPDGSPYFRGKTADAAPGGPSGGMVTFDAAPGKMQLRLAVESAQAETLDSEVREVAVPDLTAPDVVIATPQVYRARTVREFQQMKADPKAVPTAAREFGRMDRVFVRIPTYGSGAAAPTVTAKLLNRAGAPMADLPVAATAGADGGAQDVDLALASLPQGEYIVQLTVSGGGTSTQELIGFRITG